MNIQLILNEILYIHSGVTPEAILENEKLSMVKIKLKLYLCNVRCAFNEKRTRLMILIRDCVLNLFGEYEKTVLY